MKGLLASLFLALGFLSSCGDKEDKKATKCQCECVCEGCKCNETGSCECPKCDCECKDCCPGSDDEDHAGGGCDGGVCP
jgi:hypothetical protein